MSFSEQLLLQTNKGKSGKAGSSSLSSGSNSVQLLNSLQQGTYKPQAYVEPVQNIPITPIQPQQKGFLDWDRLKTTVKASIKTLPGTLKTAGGIILQSWADQTDLVNRFYQGTQTLLGKNREGLRADSNKTLDNVVKLVTNKARDVATKTKETGITEITKAREPVDKLGEANGKIQKYAELLLYNVPQLAMTTGLTFATALATKNPAAATAVGLSTGYGLGASEVYGEARKSGLSDREAQNLSSIGGIVIGSLDFLPVGKLLRKAGALDPIKKSITTKIAQGIVSTGKQAGWEGVTEGMQEIVGNAIKTTYQENQDLFEGVKESFIVGSLLGGVSDLGISGLSSLGKKQMTPEEVNNLVNEKIESAINTPEKERTPEQVEVVKALFTKELTPDQAMSLVVGNEFENSKEGKKIVLAAIEAKKLEKNLVIDSTPGKEGMEIQLVDKGKKSPETLSESLIQGSTESEFMPATPPPAIVQQLKPGETLYDYKSTQLNLPQNEASLVKNFSQKIPESDLYNPPDDPTYGREENPHITTLYGIDKSELDDVKKVVSQYKPITVTLGKITKFDNKEHGYHVLKIDVDSKELRKLNAELREKLDVAPSDFDDYRPHITIAYVKKGLADKYIGDKSFEGKKITIDNLAFTDKNGGAAYIKLEGTESKNVAQQPLRDNKNIVAYHGTSKKFDDFDFSLTGKSSGEKALFGLKGSWFVDNKVVAKDYAGEKGFVKESNIDTSNFLTIDAEGKTLNDFRDEIWSAKKQVKDEKKSGLIIKNLVDNKDYSKEDAATHIFVVDKNAINAAQQSKDTEGIIAYHGTAKKFDEFDIEKIGENQQADWGKGIYFSSDPKIAKNFAKDAGGDIVMKRKLILKNPARNADINDPDIQNALDDDMGFTDVGEVLKSKGFDGVEFTHKDGSKEYVVYDPKQIEQVDEPKSDAKLSLYDAKDNDSPTEEDEINDLLDGKVSNDNSKLEKLSLEELTGQLKQKLTSNQPEVEEAIGQIWEELELSEPGKRLFNRDSSGKMIVTGVPSTFPSWVPSELRSSKLFKEMLDKLVTIFDAPDFPTGRKARMRGLYDAILDEVDARANIDTKDIRRAIISKYAKSETRKDKAEVYTSSKGSKGDAQGQNQKISTKPEQRLNLQNTEKPKGTEKKTESKLAKRIREQLEMDLGEDAFQETLNLDKQAQMVAELIQNDPKKAARIAKGLEDTPQGMTVNALLVGLAHVAESKKDFNSTGRFWTKAVLRSRRLGQEIVSLRGTLGADSPLNAVRQVINFRIDEVGKRYKSLITKLNLPEEVTTVKKVEALVKSETQKLKKEMTDQQKRITNAQAIIDKLIC